MLAICLPEDVEAKRDNLAKRTERSKTFYAREAILEYLEDLEGSEGTAGPGELRFPKLLKKQCAAFWSSAWPLSATVARQPAGRVLDYRTTREVFAELLEKEQQKLLLKTTN